VAADDLHVAFFWTWCVRNPAFLLVAAAFAGGGLGVLEWAVAMPAAAAGAIVGDAGWHLSRKAAARAARRAANGNELQTAAEATRSLADYKRAGRDAA
jgi:hypothetical protein